MYEQAKDQVRFCHVIYFTSVFSQKWMEIFNKIALKYAAHVGRELTHFEFWPRDNKTRCSLLRYIKRNQARLSDESQCSVYKGISFYSKEKDLFWSPFFISIVKKDQLLIKMGKMKDVVIYDDYGSVIIDCDLNYLKNNNSECIFFSKQFLEDIKVITDLGYGVISAMEVNKYPRDYFRNSPSSPELTYEEEQEVQIWRREGHRFETLVRDIYWGNVLTRKHWGYDEAREQILLDVLKRECGDRVFWIDENTLFFCAPFEICPQNDPKMMAFKERLYKVFDELGIEVVRAHLDRYPEPKTELSSLLLQDALPKMPKKLRSKKRRLMIRYQFNEARKDTAEQICVQTILSQFGRLAMIIRKEPKDDGVWMEILVEGKKVPAVRKALIQEILGKNLSIEVNPPIDKDEWLLS